MPHYRKTALGISESLNANSPLPRKLRTLLISVDGRTQTEIYSKTLSSFGDVPLLLEMLALQGLVELVGEREIATDTVPANGRQPWLSTTGKHTEPDPAAVDDSPSTQPGLDAAFKSAGIKPSSLPSDDVSSWDRFQPEPGYAAPATRAPTARPGAAGNTAQYQLRSAISLMSDFVTNHLPNDALEIVLTLEGLSSVEQVVASLKGYEAMIAPTGAAARQHLADLRTLLTRN